MELGPQELVNPLCSVAFHLHMFRCLKRFDEVTLPPKSDHMVPQLRTPRQAYLAIGKYHGRDLEFGLQKVMILICIQNYKFATLLAEHLLQVQREIS